MTRTMTVPMELPASLLTRLGFESPADLRVTLAVRLVEEGRLSLGKAAELVSMHKADFMDELGRRKVSVFNWDPSEIEREFGTTNESRGTAVDRPSSTSNFLSEPLVEAAMRRAGEN